MISCMRSLEFDAAHRVVNHESKCATLHGHRYKVEIHATCSDLDSIGRVVDFSVIKETIGQWIDEQWDHTSIIYSLDVQTLEALQKIPQKKPPFILDQNPTAENMALYLLHVVCPTLLSTYGITVYEVVMWETPNCKATASL